LILVRILVFLLGAAVAARTIFSVIQSIVLPRAANDILVWFVFRTIRSLFKLRLRFSPDYAHTDRWMAYYAPVSLVSLLPFWMLLVTLGYAAMYWALGVEPFYEAYRVSGSALLTLGIAWSDEPLHAILEFSEGAIGLTLVALLIAYLPSMYAAFSRRETAVTMLEVRAGNPPSAVEMLLRYNRIHGLDHLTEVWTAWEVWFAEVQESHTSLAALSFFRSPNPEHSWVTAAGAVLDAASLTLAAVDNQYSPQAALCIRAGYLAMRNIANFFKFAYPPEPHYPDVPISVSREEFDQALAELEKGGVPLNSDREQAWRDFAGWRVNYDSLLLSLVHLTLAPESPWSGGRRYRLATQK